MTLDAFESKMPDYIQHLKESEMSDNTIKKYSLALRNFIKYAIANDCAELSKECIVEHKDYLIKKYKPATINLYIVGLNNYLKYLGMEDMRVKTLRIQAHNSLENCLTNKEYKRMLEKAANRKNNTIYYVMRALASTGIRVSTLEYFTVKTLKKGSCIITNKGKTRSIVIPDKTCKELLEFCRSKNITDGYVFFGRNPEKVISEVTVLRWLKSVAQTAGVDEDKAFPHNLRHLFAKNFIHKYRDLTELSDILGHSKIETTRIYTRTSVKEKRQKLNSLDL